MPGASTASCYRYHCSSHILVQTSHGTASLLEFRIVVYHVTSHHNKMTLVQIMQISRQSLRLLRFHTLCSIQDELSEGKPFVNCRTGTRSTRVPVLQFTVPRFLTVRGILST